jgi:membrane-associated phospholipid phosphatase
MSHDHAPLHEAPTASPRRLLALCAGALALAVAAVPFDGAISAALVRLRPAGDLRRELELIQQFGSPTTIILASLLIWRLDPVRVRRIADWLAGCAAAFAVIFLLKTVLGRPRPKLADPHALLLPWNSLVVDEGGPPVYAWQFWADGASDLWSMPSSHTAFAAVAAVFLSAMYPRLRPIVVALVVVVGFSRVVLRAHYLSDVLVGGALGALISAAAVGGAWGSRLLRPRGSGRDG